MATDVWAWTARFEVDDVALRETTAVLEMQGLDTYTEVYLNDNFLGTTANAHRPHWLAVTGRLQPGNNTLRVICFPPSEYAVAQSDAYPYFVPYTVVGCPGLLWFGGRG